MIKEDPAHHLCGHAEKMRPALPWVFPFGHAEPGFIHQGGGLEGVVPPLGSHVGYGDMPEFIVNQAISSAAAPAFPSRRSASRRVISSAQLVTASLFSDNRR